MIVKTFKTTSNVRVIVIATLDGRSKTRVATPRGEPTRIRSVLTSRAQEIASDKSSARNFDEEFDSTEQSTELSTCSSCGFEHEQERLQLDLLAWMLESFNRDAFGLGVVRQSPVTMLLARHPERREPNSTPPRFAKHLEPLAVIARPRHGSRKRAISDYSRPAPRSC